MNPPKSQADGDAHVESLAKLFREHRAWREAARYIDRDSMSDVYFTHRPGEVWHLERREEGSELVSGGARDPDFIFRFSPGAIQHLRDVTGGLDEFALALFSLIEEPDPDQRVELRLVSSFARLRQHGVLTLLLRAGPKVAAYGVRRGISGVGGIASLAKLVRQATNKPPYDWEVKR